MPSGGTSDSVVVGTDQKYHDINSRKTLILNVSLAKQSQILIFTFPLLKYHYTVLKVKMSFEIAILCVCNLKYCRWDGRIVI